MNPNFIIAGTQKGGTTSLQYYLDEHPALCMSEKKEIHFFDLNFDKTIDWYLKHFENCNENMIAGEATPYYMFHPEVAKRIYQTLPGVKIIFVLRDPTQRAWSHYWHEVVKGRETLSFERALELEEQRINSDPAAHQYKSYRSRGEYSRQIQPFMELFGKDQILILLSEELRSAPESNLKRIFEFLNVDPDFKCNRIYEKVRYEGRVPRNKSLNALIQNGLLRNIPFLKGINNILNFASRSEQMNPETKSVLDSYYQPFNKELAQLLNRQSLWA